MKKIKKMLALVLAMALVLGAMTIPAMAAQTQPDGSITVNSPIIGAKYSAYQVFEMTMDSEGKAFSYTIDTTSPFYTAVAAYAAEPDNGLTLTAITSEHIAAAGETPAYDKYNVTVDPEKFDAQIFGRNMQAAITGKLSTIDPTTGEETITDVTASASSATAISPNYETDKDVVTTAKAEKIVFGKEGETGTPLALGYYLITSVYPTETRKVTVAATADSTDPEKTWEFDKNSTDADIATAATAYAANEVTTTVVNNYIDTNNLKTKKYGAGNESKWTSADTAEIERQLKESTAADFIKDVDDKLNEIKGSESDINAKEPILVFVDSTTPNATINEKNEIPKWDVPVNPEGEASVDGLPDHGEPKGGKNIVVGEDDNGKAIYADWSEANIGDSIHYQLRVNAMNFVREGNSADDVQQVKEYFLGDYRNPHMHFDDSQGLKVTVVNDEGDIITVGTSSGQNYLDYSDKVEKFFVNGSSNDATGGTDEAYSGTVLKDDGTENGIMVPWVGVTEDKAVAEQHSVYTTNTVIQKENGQTVYQTWDGTTEGVKHEAEAPYYLLDADNNKIPVVKEYYVYCLYPSDVTIVVDYYMILDDDAVVDEPGNPNYAQYAYTPVEEETEVPNAPDEDIDKPSQLKEVDEATVYTFALAFVKVDNKGNSLANATFELPFYVNKTLQEGTYVYAMTNDEYDASTDADKATNYTNSVTTTADGVITIKGVKQGTYSFTETEAPVGFNKLEGSFTVEAKKSGAGVTTKTESTIYLDAQGNVTNVVTETTVTPAPTTDQDSNVPNVPVYEFNPVVNKQGTELPSTGGIGTTIFYVMGSILVICAGVVLITRRRMSA